MILFIGVGALLFVLDGWRGAGLAEDEQIVITPARIGLLEQALQQRYGRRASQAELNAELQAYIDEELLYREALRLGLHQSDEVVRRRLAQSMAFIIEGRADLERPGEEDLQAVYEGLEPASTALTRVSFQHVFYSADRRKGQHLPELSAVLEQLSSGAAEPGETGDPFLLGQSFRAHSIEKIAESFGQDFADSIAAAVPGQWSGPFASIYGTHLVLIEDMEEVSSRDFEQQREQLVKTWLVQRRREVREEALQQLRKDAHIELEEVTSQASQL